MKWVERRYRIRGLVQGVGFRPYMAELAEKMGVGGTVLNSGGSVSLKLLGEKRAVDAMLHRLLYNKEKGGIRIDAVELLEERELIAAPSNRFVIEESEKASDGMRILPPDIATCSACEAELFNPQDRRYRHPFISCVSCGPRYTIMETLPYDRPTTVMGDFALCDFCSEEYVRPGDRRRHAQTICCPDCGPKLFALDPGNDAEETVNRKNESLEADPARMGRSPGHAMKNSGGPESCFEGEEALGHAIEALRAGRIVAIKDIGGYHFAHLASDAHAAMRLRRLKSRDAKPFAVMFRDVEAISEVAWVSQEEKRLLESPERPIVLVRRKEYGVIPDQRGKSGERGGTHEAMGHEYGVGVGGKMMAAKHVGCPEKIAPEVCAGAGGKMMAAKHVGCPEKIAPEVCVGASRIGAMLPCNPLQMLILNEVGPLVMTSGNVAGEPIITSDEHMHILAVKNKCPDVILYTDRRIAQGLDDSICQVIVTKGGEVTQIIRRARGYVPKPIMLNNVTIPKDSLATGGDLKAVFGLGRAKAAYLSGHFGDLVEERAASAWEEAIFHMEKLLDVEPKCRVKDKHPGYVSGNRTLFPKEKPAGENETPEEKPARENETSWKKPAGENETPEEKPAGENETSWEKPSGENENAVYKIQHHHAHVLSCMAEHGLEGPVLGVAYDGTGYGEDKTIWGGEFLLCVGREFRRVGHLSSVAMMAQDVAAKLCDCAAYSYLRDHDKELAEKFACEIMYFDEDARSERRRDDPASDINIEEKGFGRFQRKRYEKNPFYLWERALDAGFGTVKNSSMGRLFDAAAAALDICHENTYEGQAPGELQAAAERWSMNATEVLSSIKKEPSLSIMISRGNDGAWVADGSKLVAQLWQRRAAGEDVGKLAWLFHWAVADMTIRMCALAEEEWTAEGKGDLARKEMAEGKGDLARKETAEEKGDLARKETAEGKGDLARKETAEEKGIEKNAVKKEVFDKEMAQSGKNYRGFPIALSGGSMQNSLLLTMLMDGLRDQGFEVYVNEQVPCGDGGLALGQLYW